MALHGINMPLQIVGLDVVWKNLLTKDLGYSPADANKFIAGPCFQAWWGMNNLKVGAVLIPIGGIRVKRVWQRTSLRVSVS